MSTDRKKVMSVAMDEDMQEFLKDYTRKHNIISVSKAIRDLVDTYLRGDRKITVVQHEPDLVPIVIKVPVKHLGKRDVLKEWLRIRMEAIADRLAASSPDKVG